MLYRKLKHATQRTSNALGAHTNRESIPTVRYQTANHMKFKEFAIIYKIILECRCKRKARDVLLRPT